jgi:putative transposase
MPRIARITIPGFPHHVTQRGNRRQRTFFSEDDFQRYLDFLGASAKAFDFDVLSYCLMPNHVHLLAVPLTEYSLRDGISQIHQSYTRLINRTQKWSGHLWQGRFFSCPVDPERAAHVARYIELNPVRAGLCVHPCDYKWSSAKASCVSPRFAPPFGSWEEFLLNAPSNDALDKSVRRCSTSGRPLGSQAFIAKLESLTGRRLATVPAGRKKAELDVLIPQIVSNTL